jgi:hypothetical protein
MKTTLAIFFATLYGVSLRIVFGCLNTMMVIMSQGFLILGPLAVGFLTIYFMPLQKVRNESRAFFLPSLTSLAILIITMFSNLEGSICWIMIFPLFAIIAGIGGIIAFKWKQHRVQKQKNRTKNILSVSFMIMLPAMVSMLEGEKSLSPETITIARSVTIAATPAAVWYQLQHIDTIAHAENSFSLSTSIGFPKHVSTTLDTLAISGHRKAIYEHGLYFDEYILEMIPEKKLVLDIQTDPNNIPPTVMDEHIIIGGKHVDILQDTYTLDALADGKTRLTLSSNFYINTPFNWYASIWAKYLMADILQDEIDLIQKRAE